ncbi:hypothetical protein NicSoilB8_41470 [Arthrobacter sp. NicSoilB8]|nr:hypothetical protein NicSoilB8_41470 [Arthrobacter sp. NicSoilB8]
MPNEAWLPGVTGRGSWVSSGAPDSGVPVVAGDSGDSFILSRIVEFAGRPARGIRQRRGEQAVRAGACKNGAGDLSWEN